MVDFYAPLSIDELSDTVANEPELDTITPDATWKTLLANHIQQFNAQYANVLYHGRQVIMRFIPTYERRKHQVHYDFIAQQSFENLYQNTRIKIGEVSKNKAVIDVTKTHAVAWLKDGRCRTYRRGVVFNPMPINAKPLPDSYYNLWQGFAVEPKKGDCTMILNHIRNVICNGDIEVYDYLIKWIAAKIQRPDKPSGAAVVLRGKKGSGKGTLGHFLMHLWGEHGLHISSSKHLTGQFNSHLEACCFLFADEAFFHGDKAGESTLKALITEPTMLIERKGFDAIQCSNYLQILMATNEKWAVPATADERRYCVLDVSDSMIGNRDYFGRLHAAMEQESVIAAFLHDMLHLDLTGWHSGDIPETDALKEQRLYSLDSIGRWLVDSVQNGHFSGCKFAENGYVWTGWPEFRTMTPKQLQASYASWCSENKISPYDIQGHVQLGKELAIIFKRTRGSAGKVYHVGTNSEARQRLCEHYNINLSEPVEGIENPYQ